MIKKPSLYTITHSRKNWDSEELWSLFEKYHGNQMAFVSDRSNRKMIEMENMAREDLILKLKSEGMNNKEIGKSLIPVISPRRVQQIINEAKKRRSRKGGSHSARAVKPF